MNFNPFFIFSIFYFVENVFNTKYKFEWNCNSARNVNGLIRIVIKDSTSKIIKSNNLIKQQINFKVKFKNIETYCELETVKLGENIQFGKGLIRKKYSN